MAALDLESLRAFSLLFVTHQSASRFAEADFDIAVNAGPVNFSGLSVDTFDTALRLSEGMLEIDKFSVGGLSGASLSATARIKDFLTAPTGNLDASVEAVDLTPLIALAAQQSPDNKLLVWLANHVAAYPGLPGDARIDFIASAVENGDRPTDVTLSVLGEAGGFDLLATLSVQAILSAHISLQLRLDFSACNEDATSLMPLASLSVLPLGMTGTGELQLMAKGATQNGLESWFLPPPAIGELRG